MPLTCSFDISGIALIEWPSRLGRITPTNRLDISFRILDDNTTKSKTEDDNAIMRHITLEAHGDQWSERLKRLVDEGYVDDLLLVFNDEMD
jgi:tRNA A37 threonylcarbamoyladenosine biosynthesis protein TsaE